MILVHGGGKQSTAWMWPLLLFLLGKNAKVRVQGKMHPEQKQLHYGDNTTSVLCKADTMELMKTTWPTHRAGELMLRLLISQRSLRVMMYLATSSQALWGGTLPSNGHHRESTLLGKSGGWGPAYPY